MQIVTRLIGALALLAITVFSVFGFMATWEYSETTKRLPWQIGYGALGLGCVIGTALLVRRRRRDRTQTKSQ